MLHEFRLEVLRKTTATKIEIERDFDEQRNLWPNAYTLTLTAGGRPLPGKEVEFWYVMQHAPGYDSWNHIPLQQRMGMGGTLIKQHTDADGQAHISLPHLDTLQPGRTAYQFIARFNADGNDPGYKPAQSPQWELRCECRPDPPINHGGQHDKGER